jgi:hypothetical protein
MCRLSWNLEASTFWNPQGLSRPVMGLLYLFTIYNKAAFTRGNGSFRGKKRTGRGVTHPPDLAPRLKKGNTYTSTLPSVPSCQVIGWPLPLHCTVCYEVDKVEDEEMEGTCSTCGEGREMNPRFCSETLTIVLHAVGNLKRKNCLVKTQSNVRTIKLNVLLTAHCSISV